MWKTKFLFCVFIVKKVLSLNDENYFSLFNNPPSQYVGLPLFFVIMWGIFGTYPPFYRYKLPFQNLPLPPRIYLPFPQLNASLPKSIPHTGTISPIPHLLEILQKSTPPSQNIPPFFHYKSDALRINVSIPEYTPIFYNYMRRSQNQPLPHKIYNPFFHSYMRHSQNLLLPPRIYIHVYVTLAAESTFLSQYISPSSTSENLPFSTKK